MPAKAKAEQLPLVEVVPVKKARRRGPPVYPEWKVVVRCLDCAFRSTVTLRAFDMHTAKKTVVGQLRDADRTAKPLPTHRHRYATAAGPA